MYILIAQIRSRYGVAEPALAGNGATKGAAQLGEVGIGPIIVTLAFTAGEQHNLLQCKGAPLLFQQVGQEAPTLPALSTPPKIA
jgi:hypothetical protein